MTVAGLRRGLRPGADREQGGAAEQRRPSWRKADEASGPAVFAGSTTRKANVVIDPVAFAGSKGSS